MKFLHLAVKLEINRRDRNKDEQPQHPRSPSTPRPAPIHRKSSSPSYPPRQDQSRYRTPSSPQLQPQRRQQSPVRQSQSRRPTVAPQPQYRRTQSLYGRSYRPRGSVPQTRPQARTVLSYPPNRSQRQPSVASLPTIDSYWSLEGLPPNHEHRHIRRSRAQNIAMVASWIDKHEGSALAVPIDSRGSSSQRGARNGSLPSRGGSHEPASVTVPDGKIDKHYVTYSTPGSNGKMRRAKYHSYSKALENPDRRVADQFCRRYLSFFRK